MTAQLKIAAVATLAAPELLRMLADQWPTETEQACEPTLEFRHVQVKTKNQRVDFDAAEKAIAALGEGWRMATKKEADSIVDLSRFNPAVDPAKHPDILSEPYWTSTPYAPDPSGRWVVGFYHGNSSVYYRDGTACVLAVRSSPSSQ